MTTEHERLAAQDATLGVGHVWTNVRCPAYRSYNPAECTCTSITTNLAAFTCGGCGARVYEQMACEHDEYCPDDVGVVGATDRKLKAD